MTPSNIILRFCGIGIYLYNPDVIPDEAFTPSNFTQLPISLDEGIEQDSQVHDSTLAENKPIRRQELVVTHLRT